MKSFRSAATVTMEIVPAPVIDPKAEVFIGTVMGVQVPGSNRNPRGRRAWRRLAARRNHDFPDKCERRDNDQLLQVGPPMHCLAATST
jgi:hypothetical protein